MGRSPDSSRPASGCGGRGTGGGPCGDVASGTGGGRGTRTRAAPPRVQDDVVHVEGPALDHRSLRQLDERHDEQGHDEHPHQAHPARYEERQQDPEGGTEQQVPADLLAGREERVLLRVLPQRVPRMQVRAREAVRGGRGGERQLREHRRERHEQQERDHHRQTEQQCPAPGPAHHHSAVPGTVRSRTDGRLRPGRYGGRTGAPAPRPRLPPPVPFRRPGPRVRLRPLVPLSPRHTGRLPQRLAHTRPLPPHARPPLRPGAEARPRPATDVREGTGVLG
ncbi:predicted protein [Streptomyces sp. SPB78]|nr:predicted protein [Streptomyces sp. SPB78]